MPPTGTPGEAFRLLWHFAVGTEQYRFTAKSIDIGKPDVIAQSGTERVGQVDTDGHFRLEQCTDEPAPAVLTLVQCRPVEYLDGSFDPATKTLNGGQRRQRPTHVASLLESPQGSTCPWGFRFAAGPARSCPGAPVPSGAPGRASLPGRAAAQSLKRRMSMPRV